MIGFSKKEQRFYIVVLFFFIIGLAVSHYRKNKLSKPDKKWESSYNSILAEFRAISDSINTPIQQQINQALANQDQSRQKVKESFVGKINLNTASSNELQNLVRIGPATAAKIIEYRNEYGPFEKIEDIQNVKGIGPKTFELIKNYIKVE